MVTKYISTFQLGINSFPVENTLNIIGMIFTSANIRHKLPVCVDFDSTAYVDAADDCDGLFNSLLELKQRTDYFVRNYVNVEADVLKTRYGYRITFFYWNQ